MLKLIPNENTHLRQSEANANICELNHLSYRSDASLTFQNLVICVRVIKHLGEVRHDP
jgi:hypothetical protein